MSFNLYHCFVSIYTNIHWINYLIFICEIIRCMLFEVLENYYKKINGMMIGLQSSLIISTLNEDMFQIIFKKLLRFVNDLKVMKRETS